MSSLAAGLLFLPQGLPVGYHSASAQPAAGPGRTSVTRILTWPLEKSSLSDLKALVSRLVGDGTRSPCPVGTVRLWALPGTGTGVCPAPSSSHFMAGQQVSSKSTGDLLPGAGLFVLTSPGNSPARARASGSPSPAAPFLLEGVEPFSHFTGDPAALQQHLEVSGTRAGPGTTGSPGLQRNCHSPHFDPWERGK